MAIDLSIFGFLLLCGLLGLVTGTVKQLTHWAGLLLGRAAAKPLALILTLALAPNLGIPPAAIRVGLSALCFYTLYVVGTIIAGFLLKKLVKDKEKSRLDRAGGFVLGMGNGAIVAFVLLSALLFFEKPLELAFQRRPEAVRSSRILGLVRPRNLFGAAPLPAMANLDKLMEVANDPRAAQALADDPRIKELLEDPALKASLQDDALAKAIKAGDWSTLKNDPRIAELLKNPRIVGPLTDSLDYDYEEK